MTNIKQSIIPELVSGSSTQVVVVNNKGRHSRGFLSGIFHAPYSYFLSRQKGYKKRAANAHKKHFQPGSLTTRCAQTNQTPKPAERLFDSPLRRPLHGFTLIELLVVVLIIGILAAVALPQYQKAVEKTRIANAMTILNAVTKGIEIYVLEKGFPIEGTISFFGESEMEGEINESLEIDMEGSMVCGTGDGGGYCTNGKFFTYTAACWDNGCSVTALRVENGWIKDDGKLREDITTMDFWPYEIWLKKSSTTGQWTKNCRFFETDNFGKSICDDLEAQGWTKFSL